MAYDVASFVCCLVPVDVQHDSGTACILQRRAILLWLAWALYLCLKLLDMLVDIVSHFCFGSFLWIVLVRRLQTFFAESLDLHFLLTHLQGTDDSTRQMLHTRQMRSCMLWAD